MTDDFEQMWKKDVEKFRSYSGDGMDTSLPAMIELGFTMLTAFVGIVWLISLYWVPDAMDGTTWMGLGALGMVMFGLPAGLIYVLRRGGARVIMEVVQGVSR